MTRSLPTENNAKLDKMQMNIHVPRIIRDHEHSARVVEDSTHCTTSQRLLLTNTNNQNDYSKYRKK
jgi:hypothetical protein